MSGQLFREEALRHRTDRLHGNVTIAVPVTWQVIGLLLFGILVLAIAFLSKASYARVQNVSGSIVLDKGVVSIVPSRAGTVARIFVQEGQRVRAGASVAIIRAEENLLAGGTAPDRIQRALSEQNSRLEDQIRGLLQATVAERSKAKAQLDGALAAIPEIKGEIADQQELLGTAMADYANAVEVAKRGFISRRFVQDRQATVLSRRQQLAKLREGLSAKYAEVAQAKQAMSAASANGSAQAANAQSGRAALSNQLTEAESSRGYVLTSPADGIITAITARPGQPAALNQQMMLIILSSPHRVVRVVS